MSEGLSAVASSGDVLARFAGEAAAFVTAVEGGIDAVRRRAGETGELAREVTATAERGEALVNDSVQGMYRVEETIRRASEIVDALGQPQPGDSDASWTSSRRSPTRPTSWRSTPRSSPPRPASRAVAFGVVADEDPRARRAHRAQHPGDCRHRAADARPGGRGGDPRARRGASAATAGVALGDRAATALKEIRAITQRTFAAVEATVAETARLEAQGGARGAGLRPGWRNGSSTSPGPRWSRPIAGRGAGAPDAGDGPARPGGIRQGRRAGTHRPGAERRGPPTHRRARRNSRRARGADPRRRGHLRGRGAGARPMPRRCSESATGSAAPSSSSRARRRASRPRCSASASPRLGGAGL